MLKENKELWIISVCGLDDYGKRLRKFYGSEHDAKEFLVELMQEDKENDLENFKYGTDDVSLVEKDKENNSWYAYGRYEKYRVDYEAIRFDSIPA